MAEFGGVDGYDEHITSYFYGCWRVMETRPATQLAIIGNFGRQAFNDFVLSQRLLPSRLLCKAEMAELVRG